MIILVIDAVDAMACTMADAHTMVGAMACDVPWPDIVTIGVNSGKILLFFNLLVLKSY